MSDAKMADERLKAIQRLADILAEENVALRRLDFPAVVALVGAKEAALAALPTPAMVLAPSTTLAQRLVTLAAENQILLERAITVQSRVVRVIARAAAPPPAATHYGGCGRPSNPLRTRALALSTRA